MKLSQLTFDDWDKFRIEHHRAYYSLLHTSLEREYEHLKDFAAHSETTLNDWEVKRLSELTDWKANTTFLES